MVLTAVATLGLIAVGGLVTSHGAGMAVPDWPNTYGYNMFLFPISQWMGGILYEHSHRLVAAGVGLLTSVLAVWLWARETAGARRWMGILAIVLVLGLMGARQMPVYVTLASAALLLIPFGLLQAVRQPGQLRWLGMVALAAVILQGVLGGLRVVWFKDQIGIFHATLAQLFFSFLCVLALLNSRWWADGVASLRLEQGRVLRWLPSITTVLVLGQLVLGAAMRHQHAGLAIPDFPLAYGKVWPETNPNSVAAYNARRMEVVAAKPITATQVQMQMLHRLNGVAILACMAAGAWVSRRILGSGHVLSRLALAWLMLGMFQFLLGAATVWSNKAADIATAHVVGGAVALALGALASTVAFRALRFSPEGAAQLRLAPDLHSRPSTAVT